MVFLNGDVHRRVLCHIPFLLLQTTAVSRQTLSLSITAARIRVKSALNAALGEYGDSDVYRILSAVPGSVATGPGIASILADHQNGLCRVEVLVPYSTTWKDDVNRAVGAQAVRVTERGGLARHIGPQIPGPGKARGLRISARTDPVATALDSDATLGACYLDSSGLYAQDPRYAAGGVAGHVSGGSGVLRFRALDDPGARSAVDAGLTVVSGPAGSTLRRLPGAGGTPGRTAALVRLRNLVPDSTWGQRFAAASDIPLPSYHRYGLALAELALHIDSPARELRSLMSQRLRTGEAFDRPASATLRRIIRSMEAELCWKDDALKALDVHVVVNVPANAGEATQHHVNIHIHRYGGLQDREPYLGVVNVIGRGPAFEVLGIKHGSKPNEYKLYPP